jgi:hypothetical protein
LPSAASVAAAMARSNAPPVLRRSAGARLTVITYSLRSTPSCCSADRTRTRLSRTLASARPTIENEAGPRPESTSTRTACASRPTRQRVVAVACMTGHIANAVPAELTRIPAGIGGCGWRTTDSAWRPPGWAACRRRNRGGLSRVRRGSVDRGNSRGAERNSLRNDRRDAPSAIHARDPGEPRVPWPAARPL